MPETKQAKPKEKSKDVPGEARMSHLLSYEGSRGQEIRLHDAEFRSEHYFDFRFYDKGSEGMIPTKRGIRLSLRDVGYLEDAIPRWKEYLKGLKQEESGETSESISSKKGRSATNV